MPVCPRCDHPYAADVVGTSGAVDLEKGSQARTCFVGELVDGEPHVHVYHHTHEDLEAGAIDEATPDEAPDPMDLTPPHSRVYALINNATATGGTIVEAELGGKAIDLGIPPDEIKETARELADQGYVESPEDAVYRVPRGEA